MRIEDVLVLYNKKLKDIETQFGEDAEGLKNDDNYKKLSMEYARFIRYCVSKLPENKAQDLINKLGTNEIKGVSYDRRTRKNVPTSSTAMTAPSWFIKEHKDIYQDIILSDADLVEEINLNLINEEIDLPLIGIETFNTRTNREREEKLQAAKEELRKNKIESIEYKYTAETYLNKLDEYAKAIEKNPKDDRTPVGIRKLQKQFMETINFVYDTLTREGKDVNAIIDGLDIAKEDKDALKTGDQNEIFKNRDALRTFLTNDEVVNTVEDIFAVTDINIGYVEDHTARINGIAQKKFDDIEYQLAHEQIDNSKKNRLDRYFLETDNDNFLKNGDENLLDDRAYGTMKLLGAAAAITKFNENDIEWGTDFVRKARVSIQLLTNYNNLLRNEDFRREAFEDTFGTPEYQQHFGNLDVGFQGVNDKNIDMIVDAIASIKINHNARPWYQKFFGYFGKIGNELKEADELAKNTARMYNLDLNTLKTAVNERAGIKEDKQEVLIPDEKTALDKLRESVQKLDLTQSKEEQIDKGVYKYENLTKADKKPDLEPNEYLKDVEDEMQFDIEHFAEVDDDFNLDENKLDDIAIDNLDLDDNAEKDLGGEVKVSSKFVLDLAEAELNQKETTEKLQNRLNEEFLENKVENGSKKKDDINISIIKEPSIDNSKF